MNAIAKTKLTFGLLGAAILIGMGQVACSPAKWQETYKEVKAPNTGNPIAERQVAPQPLPQPRQGDRGFVSSDRLCGRRIKGRDCAKDDVVIERNDEIRVKRPKDKGEDLVEVEVVKSQRPDVPPVTVYVPPEYINKEPVKPTVEENAADRYFVVQNIATEKLRLYEKCGAQVEGACVHRLVLETDMVVGQDIKGRRSLLGSFTLTKWFKFYEDNKGDYPSWFDPSYPQIPGIGADLKAWASKTILPTSKSGSLRGAFGWYTAYLAPNAREQWTHGTWGWGKDGGRFIEALKKSPNDINSRVTSHGCSRVENQAIALMRELLVPGSKIIKIYARETSSGSTTPGEEGKWKWILTKDGVNEENGPRMSLVESDRRKVSRSQILEHGTYRYTAKATAIPLNDSKNVHTNGNSYSINANAFQGTFDVDTGRLSNDYRHPKSSKLEVGGHIDERLPSVVLARGAAEGEPAPAKIPRAKDTKPSQPELEPVATAEPGVEGEPGPDGPTVILDPKDFDEAASR